MREIEPLGSDTSPGAAGTALIEPAGLKLIGSRYSRCRTAAVPLGDTYLPAVLEVHLLLCLFF